MLTMRMCPVHSAPGSRWEPWWNSRGIAMRSDDGRDPSVVAFDCVAWIGVLAHPVAQLIE